MEIKCILHSNKAAQGLCQECSFLCELHQKEEYEKGHVLINMNKPIADLYEAMANEKTAFINGSSIAILKEIVNGFFNHEMTNNVKQRQQAKENVIRCKDSVFGLDIDKVSEHITKALNLYNDEKKYTNEVTIINNLIGVLLHSKEKVENNIEFIKTTKEKIMESSKIYKRNEIFGINITKKASY